MRREEIEKRGRKEEKEKTKKEKNYRDKKDSRGVENLGWRRRNSKIGERSKKVGVRKIL